MAAADSAVDSKPYRPPTGAEKVLTWKAGRATHRVQAGAGWELVREGGMPVAEVFYISYERQPRDPRRPVMFLLNGGPGAASAFLHMGVAGPQRIEFSREGKALPPPVKLTPNAESWLAFADLVFVDPVGTGLSRTVAEARLEQQGADADDKKRAALQKKLAEAKKEFCKVKRDIDVLCEFTAAYLSRTKRWESPVYVAGESYGGFRAGKLVRALPERGVGLCGAILVSPAMDFLYLVGADYDLMPWLNTVPTMALVAGFHGRTRGAFARLSGEKLRAAAEGFAEQELAGLLLRGERAGEAERTQTFGTFADLIGLPRERVLRCGGRVPIELFSQELLREQNQICGLYDGSVTGPNIFPDREHVPGANPDPTLAGIMSPFNAAANIMLRSEIGLATQREYVLLSEEVWKNWADDRAQGYWHRQLECADDLRYGMGVNPNLRVLIAHGWYDMVTTFYSSAQSVASLRLPAELRGQLRLANYDGGHMFYTWERSRKAVTRDVERLVSGG